MEKVWWVRVSLILKKATRELCFKFFIPTERREMVMMDRSLSPLEMKDENEAPASPVPLPAALSTIV